MGAVRGNPGTIVAGCSQIRGALGGLLGVEFVASCLDVIQWPGEPRSTLEAAEGAELDTLMGSDKRFVSGLGCE